VITAFDPLKGRGKVLRTIKQDLSNGYGGGALSPDGSTVAISGIAEPEIHIRLLSLSGGSDRDITVKGWPNISGLDWSADGKGLYCGSVSPQGDSVVWGIPSPDGRYLAIMGAVINSNVWMIEGF
jgi:Tol biopolymer transport system component